MVVCKSEESDLFSNELHISCGVPLGYFLDQLSYSVLYSI